ncbi:MAG TPA: hypothetical protein VFP87_13125 [Chitinophagaceae bacterium]|nr:hypothetical protein [Chitinophagaceae bacterium]
MKSIYSFIPLFGAAMLIACKKDSVKRNEPPIAFARPDITIMDSSGTAQLMGRGFDLDGKVCGL